MLVPLLRRVRGPAAPWSQWRALGRRGAQQEVPQAGYGRLLSWTNLGSVCWHFEFVAFFRFKKKFVAVVSSTIYTLMFCCCREEEAMAIGSIPLLSKSDSIGRCFWDFTETWTLQHLIYIAL
jgi:hypothetical protein